ncbi:MAG: von Willebrand factor type A domain-containing protein [Bacteroidales bacterium]|nr:von Willebrand factor type A domain-containing protein [Bacteroidales bacterium]MCM1415799.1 von Willebrand factor type A domain-containing protein [bacterium]MCM1422707.1 von Willebrand factor type A domain-containing protein [bacterium]
MKKRKNGSCKKITAFSLAAAVILTGCGAQSDGAPTVEEYIQEAPTDSGGENMTDMSELLPIPSGSAEGSAAEAGTGEENMAPGSASGAADSAENATAEAESSAADDFASGASKEMQADGFSQNSAADVTGSGYNDLARGDAAQERKMEGIYDESAIKAPEGYLGSCYEYGDEIIVTENNEEYSKWQEKGYVDVMREPLSTFAADVDTASYSNLRRMIRDGWDLENLPEGSARIEEMLNYFSYDLAEPRGQEPFGVTTQIGKCPWNEEAELLLVGLKTQSVDYSLAPASNLVFLLDVSGSMNEPDKLPLLQESFTKLAENLSDKDRISIVTYATEDKIVLQGARGDEKRKIKKALNGLEAGGGTYGSKGIETAYALAEEYFIKGGNNRVILATDGDLNIGMTTEEELEELITEKKESGIFLSVLGFGTGNIKDNKMETLADKGNGNYAYIDCLREAEKVLSEEMTATLLTVCKDVKFQVEFNPDVVAAYRLLGYENRALDRQDFDDDEKDGGEIGAGHSVTVLYEIIPWEPLQKLSESEIEDLKYGSEYRKKLNETGRTPTNDSRTKEWLTVSVRYKKPAANVSRLLEYAIGDESYRADPSEDFLFAAAVAEFGLLASHSDYPEGASLSHVRKTLRGLDLDDVYKAEFLELVETVE